MKKKLTILVTLLFISALSFAQGKQNLESGIALQKYDAVSYFKGKPVIGYKSLSYTYNGATYYFATGDNLKEFKKSPEKYVPEYGGWCAYAMGNDGTFVEIDPETYKIVNGKLYLFYNAYFTNTKDKWNKDEARLKSNADKNWSKIISK